VVDEIEMERTVMLATNGHFAYDIIVRKRKSESDRSKYTYREWN
jgi:hypothetical protein